MSIEADLYYELAVLIGVFFNTESTLKPSGFTAAAGTRDEFDDTMKISDCDVTVTFEQLLCRALRIDAFQRQECMCEWSYDAIIDHSDVHNVIIS